MKRKSLSPEQLRRKLQKKGISFPRRSHEKDAQKIQEIGYYKLKEFAAPFAKRNKKGKRIYRKLNFYQLVTRYYQDKNLRIYLLHAIEDIEVFLNNKIAALLGDKYGAFGYLNFKNWCNRKNSKFDIETKQFYFKQDLLKRVTRSKMNELQDADDFNPDGFPNVWLMTNCLTFGDSIFLYSLMSKNNQHAIARLFSLRTKELLSVLRTLNLIRNICCHNSNLIDFKLETKPPIPHGYKQFLFHRKGVYTNKLALIIVLIKYLMQHVNPKYNFQNIFKALATLVEDNRTAHFLGFRNTKSVALIEAH